MSTEAYTRTKIAILSELLWRLVLVAAVAALFAVGEPDLLDALTWWMMATDKCAAIGV
jgi:hypothetical protein